MNNDTTVLTTIKTTCPYCGVGCGIDAQVDEQNRQVNISGDELHPANFGRLCSKGSTLGETVELKGRLLQPKVYGRDSSWAEALDLVADSFISTIEKYGPDAVAIYGSGQLLTEDYYVANKLMKGFIGSGNMDTNSRLCMSSSVAGHKRAFGSDTVPGCYDDYEQAELIVLIGSNTLLIGFLVSNAMRHMRGGDLLGRRFTMSLLVIKENIRTKCLQNGRRLHCPAFQIAHVIHPD